MSEQDTREQLEADMREILMGVCEEVYTAHPKGTMFDLYGNPDVLEELLGSAIGLLDRQAAITRRECDRPNWDYCETCDALAELTAERDELQAAIDAMNNGQFYAMYKAKCEECEQLKKVVRTPADSFKSLEIELSMARGEQ